MFSFIRARINGWINSREAGDLSRHHAHYDAIVMFAMEVMAECFMSFSFQKSVTPSILSVALAPYALACGPSNGHAKIFPLEKPSLKLI